MGDKLTLGSNQALEVLPLENDLIRAYTVLNQLLDEFLVVLNEKRHDLLHFDFEHYIPIRRNTCSLKDALIILDPRQQNQKVPILFLLRHDLKLGHHILLNIKLVALLKNLEHLVPGWETFSHVVQNLHQVVSHKLRSLNDFNDRLQVPDPLAEFIIYRLVDVSDGPLPHKLGFTSAL